MKKKYLNLDEGTKDERTLLDEALRRGSSRMEISEM